MWYQLLAASIGVWLMGAPAVLGISRPEAVSAWVAGPVVASLATVAIWEVTRSVRCVNLVPALWLILAPFLLEHTGAGTLNSIVCGLAIGGLSGFGGRVRHRFDGGWWSIVRKNEKQWSAGNA